MGISEAGPKKGGSVHGLTIVAMADGMYRLLQGEKVLSGVAFRKEST